MFEHDRADSRVASAVEQLAASWEELAAIEPVALSGAELLDLLDRLETTARRHVGVACRVIAELAARGTAGEAGYPSVAALLSQRLPPRFPQVGDGRTCGATRCRQTATATCAGGR